MRKLVGWFVLLNGDLLVSESCKSLKCVFCSFQPCRWQVGAGCCPVCVWGCLVSCAWSGCPLPPFQTINFPWRPWMQWTEELFCPRVLFQRWSLPPSVHTEGLATVTAAATRSCPSSSGGAVDCSRIFPVTLNASTVPHPPAWSQATARYQRYLTLAQTEQKCMLRLIIIII